MKNITKQNIKTNPLWIRLLIMTFMLLIGTSSAWANKAIYLDPGVWNTDNPTYDVWAWKSGGNGVRYQSTKVGSYYQAIVPDDVTHVIWFRRSASVSGTGWSDANIWNRSNGDAGGFASGSSGYNLLKITGWGSNGNSTWSASYYDDITTYTVSGTGATVKLSDSDKWVTYTLYKDGAAVSNSAKTGTGSALSWTVTTGGVYTIKGTNTYKTEDMSGSYTYASTYTVKKTESGANGGTVKLGTKTLSTTAASINSGSYDLSITAPNGYNVSKVEVSGGSLTTAGTTGSSSYTGKVNVSANTTVTVTYAKLTYSISYNANGGTGAPTADTKTYGETLTLSSTIPTRTGYTFQNWNTASNGSGTTYKSGASYTANEAATLYAQWKADTYKITYKDQGGAAFSGTHAAGAPTTHTYGAKTTLKDPTKSGYNFLGWFTKSDCSGTAVASLGATAYTADITLYAKWEKICVPETSITSAELQQDGTISLAGNFTTCGAKFHGFQWRKVGSNWCGETGYANNKESNYVTIGNTDVNGSETASFTPEEEGVTYEFRTYIVTTSPWLYSTTTKEVSTCVNVVEPAVSMSPANGVVCQGSPVTLTLTTRQSGVVYKIGNEEIFKSTTTYSFVPKTNSVTVTASHEKACDGTNNKTKTFSISIKSLPEAPVFASSSMTVCAGEPFSLPKPTNLKEGTEDCIWSVGGKTTTGSQPGISQTTVYTAVKNDGCPSPSVEFPVNVTPIPTISGATFTQPGKDNAIELTVPTGNDTKWTVNNNGDLSVATGSSTMFSAENEDTYTITADNKGCTDTHVVTVSDAFYVYMRQPKEGETAYNNFYYPTQNPTQGGDLFYKEYASIPPAEGYTDYNQGGRAHDVILTDCDGYVWYGFKASAQLIDGTNYFTVHAPNKNGYDGWFTHTDITKPGKMTGDIYYIMGTEGNGNSGWKIEEASAPYAGPVVHASGNDFSFNKNNFADFVALYVTDCSGKEVKSYQWQYSATENGKYDNYSSVCTYVGKKSEQGDAGKTNNIRPNVAGWYRCTATYTDGSSRTSAAKQVTATSGTSYSFTSDLPIIMVNTNGYGFPSCDGLSGTASKNADVLKAKISVDVKIKLGNDIVYDRKARMNYRGSSSLNFVKKSYAFCPGKADCVEDKGRVDYVKTEKLNMLNVGSAVDKDWVLYAAAADPSIMRNRLVFDTFRDMTGSWSVQSRYVELIVDGEYKGIYVFMDKITNNANRVNITDENGFILKFDKTDIVDRYEGSGDKKTFKSLYSGKDGSGTYDTQIDQRFEIEYPEMEDVEEEEAGKWATTVNNIKSMINNFETQLKAGNYAEVQKIIDYKSWADWFIITEYAKNMDAYRASCLFVYNGDKLEARPLWDQELSFKNYCATLCDDYSCDNAEGLLIRTSKIYEDTESCSAPFWFTGKYVQGRGTEAIGGSQQFVGYLLNDPCFVQTVKDRWNEHKNKALSAESLNAKLEKYTNEMATALDREKSIWKSEGGKLSRETCQCSYNGTTGYSDIKISESKGDITEWINARPSKLEEALKDEIGTGLSISFSEENINTTPWEPVVLQVHNESGYHYTLTYTDNALDQQAGIIIEKNGDTYKYNIPRPANWGTGNEATEGERADIVYGLKATLQMDSSNVVCGSQAEVPFDEATITLQDEPNEDCSQP